MANRSSFFGATAMASANALRVAIQIAILPIIGRLIGPHAYGEMALVSPFIFLAMLLTESGLGGCIVRATTITRELEGTIFCFSTGFSLIVIGFFAALSRPIGAFLAEPDFPLLLIAMSSILLLASFNIVPAALILRAKRYGWIAAGDVISSLGGILAVVLGVVLGWGVWSLVAQQIVFWLCKLAVLVSGSRFRPNLRFRWAVLKENLYFGSNLTGTSLLSFIARNIDNVLIGKSMGSGALGFYALAFQIVGMPSLVLGGSVYYTAFAATSEAHRQGRATKDLFLTVLRSSLLISAPTIVGLAVTAPTSVPLLMGDRWMPTTHLLMFLAPLGLVQALGPAQSGVIVGMGRADIGFRLMVITSVTTVIAIVLGVQVSSTAVAIGVSVAAVIGYLLGLRTVMTLCDISVLELGTKTFPALAASCVMGCAVGAMRLVLPVDVSLWFQLLLCSALGVCVYGGILFIFFNDQMPVSISEFRRQLKAKA